MSKTKKLKSILGMLALSTMGACSSEADAKPEGQDVSKKEEKTAKVSNKVCQPTLMEVEAKGKKQTTNLFYTANQLDSLVVSATGRPEKIVIRYSYNEKKQLTQIDMKGEKDDYVYENDLIKRIESGQLATVFDYNEKNQLVSLKEQTKGHTTSEYKYEYDQNGAPIKRNFYNAKGELVVEVTYEYDSMKNPYVGLGRKTNLMEAMNGYPVGNYKHNVLKATQTVHKKSFFIEGKPGDVIVSEFKHTYDESGYPTTFLNQFFGQSIPTSIQYKCD